MRLVNINLQEDVIKQIDSVVSAFGFANRSEFIRNAIQERLQEYRVKQALLALSRNKGIMKGRGVTDEEYELARERAFEKIAAEFK